MSQRAHAELRALAANLKLPITQFCRETNWHLDHPPSEPLGWYMRVGEHRVYLGPDLESAKTDLRKFADEVRDGAA